MSETGKKMSQTQKRAKNSVKWAIFDRKMRKKGQNAAFSVKNPPKIHFFAHLWSKNHQKPDFSPKNTQNAIFHLKKHLKNTHLPNSRAMSGAT
jgi:hypothetical protein